MDDFSANELEARSWRVAADLVRRHPELRLLRTFPGGGQYDCLTLVRRDGERGTLQLNRLGSIHVLQRFDRDGPDVSPISWETVAAAGPAGAPMLLEEIAGLVAPRRLPSGAPVGHLYRVFAAIVGAALESSSEMRLHLGYVDSSGTDGGRNQLVDRFDIPAPFLVPDDQFGEPGYHLWVVTRDGQPLLAFDEISSSAWTLGNSRPIPIGLGQRSWVGNRPTAVALRLLVRATDPSG